MTSCGIAFKGMSLYLASVGRMNVPKLGLKNRVRASFGLKPSEGLE